MASEQGQGGVGAAWTVVLGPGERLGGMEGLARAASTRRDPGLAATFERLDDLAELLAPRGARGARGRLVLDGDDLPLEDLGFVRRFLAAAPGWSVLLIGEDAGHRAARAALSLARTRWMAWPPDLAQLEELVGAPDELRPFVPTASGGASRSLGSAAPQTLPGLADSLAELSALAQRVQSSAGSGDGADGEPDGDLARLTRLARALHLRVAPPRPVATSLDLGALLEELLAALTLRGKKAPRFLYRGTQGVAVYASRPALSQALESLLLLARGCAGPGEMVRVQLLAQPGPSSSARLQVDFPAGALASIDPVELLSGELPEPIGEVAPVELAAARSVLGALGGRVELRLPQEGAAQLEVQLPAQVQAPQEGSSVAVEVAEVAGAAGGEAAG